MMPFFFHPPFCISSGTPLIQDYGDSAQQLHKQLFVPVTSGTLEWFWLFFSLFVFVWLLLFLSFFFLSFLPL